MLLVERGKQNYKGDDVSPCLLYSVCSKVVANYSLNPIDVDPNETIYRYIDSVLVSFTVCCIDDLISIYLDRPNILLSLLSQLLLN